MLKVNESNQAQKICIKDNFNIYSNELNTLLSFSLNHESILFIVHSVKTDNELWIFRKLCLNDSLILSYLYLSLKFLLNKLKHISIGANSGLYVRIK